MTYRDEFPNFGDDIPVIPSGFDDVSWRNDSCPSFLNEARRLIVFIDFADKGLRENEDSPRFTLHLWSEGTCGVIAESDQWADIEAAVSDPMAFLVDQYAAYCDGQGLPACSADELDPSAMTGEQRAWVAEFVTRWENMEEATQ